ncbi:MAG: acyltransferase [Phycisphaeraceae bacterium]|nr:MAG: acyltransferase [Phycisphaeraceae bacterium]
MGELSHAHPPTASDAAPPARAGWSGWVLSKLSRVTSSGRFLPEIDGLRFLAIISVILLHVSTVARQELVKDGTRGGFADAHETDWVGNILHRGGVGVLVFFGISGFILAFPFALHHLEGARKVRLKDYFIRRVTRLEPPYLVALVGMYAALHLLGPRMGVPAEKMPGPEHLGASALYVHNVAFGEYSRVNGVAWSLEVEVQFYILAPALALIFTLPKVVRRSILVSAILAGGFFKGGFDDVLRSYRLDMTLAGYLHCFLVGFLFADVFITDWKQKPSHGSWRWDLAGLAGMAGILPAGGVTKDQVFANGLSHSAAYLPLFLVSNFVVFCAVFRGRLVRAFFTNAWIATIGGMCYSIYLIHQPMVHVLGKVTGRMVVGEAYWVNVLVQSVLIVPVVVALCAVFFVLIERPCMYKDWPQRLWSRVRRAAGAG